MWFYSSFGVSPCLRIIPSIRSDPQGGEFAVQRALPVRLGGEPVFCAFPPRLSVLHCLSPPWGCSRAPRGTCVIQYVPGRVHVPVVVRPAGRAVLAPDRQVQPVQHVAAVRAALAAGQEAVDDDELPPVPGGLVGQLPAQFPEAGVAPPISTDARAACLSRTNPRCRSLGSR